MDPTIELYRLARAIHLDVEPTGVGDTFWVVGGERRHFVDYRQETCDCTDRAMHPETLCKHLLAVALRMGEPEVLRRLRWFIPMPGSRRRLPARV